MVSNSIPFNLAAHKTVKRMKTEERIPRKAMEEKKKKKKENIELAIDVFELKS